MKRLSYAENKMENGSFIACKQICDEKKVHASRGKRLTIGQNSVATNAHQIPSENESHIAKMSESGIIKSELCDSTQSKIESPTKESSRDTPKEVRVLADTKCGDSEANINISIPCIIPRNVQVCFEERESGADTRSHHNEEHEEKQSRVDDSPCDQEEQQLDEEKKDGIEARLQQEQENDCKYNRTATMPSMIACSTMPEPLDHMIAYHFDNVKLVRHDKMLDGISDVHALYCATLAKSIKSSYPIMHYF